MKFYTFGKEDLPAILLLPGTCCHWKLNFGEVIQLLERDFHMVCASYDGFDETEDTIFPDMLLETERIESYIREHYNGRICAAYGCSLGGSFVGLLVQRGNIHIDHAILGSSDLDQDVPWKAKLKCKIAIPLLHRIVSTGEYPKVLQGLIEKKRTPYGDMEIFVEELKAEGYEEVQLIKTTNRMFMNPGEAKLIMLAGSTLLLGRK